MSQVLVWKSDADGKLFEDKKKYQSHLRKLAAQRQQARKIAATKVDRELFLDKIGQVGSIKELEQFIKDNWKWFFANGVAGNEWRNRGKAYAMHEHVEVSFDQLRWSHSVSNSHRCPRNGVTCWSSAEAKDGRPRGYPGWTAQLKIHVRTPQHTTKKETYAEDGFGSDYFDRTPINTGGGGGGGKKGGVVSYSYSTELFAADFPVMAENRQKAEFLKKMGSNVNEFGEQEFA